MTWIGKWKLMIHAANLRLSALTYIAWNQADDVALESAAILEVKGLPIRIFLTILRKYLIRNELNIFLVKELPKWWLNIFATRIFYQRAMCCHSLPDKIEHFCFESDWRAINSFIFLFENYIRKYMVRNNSK